MSYNQFKDYILKNIPKIPKNHIFNLREIFGTEIWVTLKDQKLNYGSRFFKECEEIGIPGIKAYGKDEIQGEQLYQKL